MNKKNFEKIPESFIDSTANMATIEGVIDPTLLQDIESNIVNLPADASYQYYFYQRSDVSEIADEVSMSIRELPLARSIACEIGSICVNTALFLSRFDKDSQPFVSLRIVNPTYLGGCLCGECEPCLGREASVSRDWHVDTSRLTATTALAGPQVVHTPNGNVNRDYFRQHKIVSPQDDSLLPLKDPALFSTKSSTDILLLKGELRDDETPGSLEFLNELGLKKIVPYNEDNGLVHTVPLSGLANTRLVMTVSTYLRDEFRK